MSKKFPNYTFIDGVNLHKGVLELGWRLDYKKFRRWLRDKHSVEIVFIFLGMLPENTILYRDLQRWGYTVVFKPTIPDGSGHIKGNCDAELVLQAVSSMYEGRYDKCILISGDGDFACLVRFLFKKGRFGALVSPNRDRCSIFLKQAAPRVTYLEELRTKLEYLGRTI